MDSSSPQGQPPNQHRTTESTTITSSNCHICNKPCDHTDTIKCFKCSSNYHKLCVNVSNSERSLTWVCPNCDMRPPRAASVRSGSSISSRSRRHELELQRLQEETQLEREFIKRKYQILERANEDMNDAQTINNSVHEWLNNQPNPTQQSSSMHEPTNMEATHLQPQSTFSETPFISTLPQPTVTTNSQTTSSQIPTCSQYVSNNLVFTTATQPVYSTTFSRNMQSFNNNNTTTNNLHSTTENPPLPPIIDTENPVSHPTQSEHPFNFNNINPSFSMHPSFTFRPSTGVNRRLTQEQINARQSVPKELPIFTGKPEEWPLFSSTYDWSTSVCGLTDTENLVRLQKALRGEALRSVEHILIHPYGVACAISTLKLLYGQPEKILSSLKNKIKLLPNVNTNKLNTIAIFAVEIKGLETTIRACGLLDELKNSSLLQELIMKLPSNLQLNWGEQKTKLIKNNQRANLTDFANWIFEVGVAASSVNIESSSSNTLTSTEQHSRRTRNAFINAHEINNKNNCVVCFDNCSSVDKCKKFLAADRNERWDLIRKYNLCKQCLKRHYGICKSKIFCSKQGCQIKHHSLLHKLTEENSKTTESKETNKTNENLNKNNTPDLHAAHNGNLDGEILFKILPITIYGNNKSLTIFAFIDEGSSISLIDEEVINELNLTGYPQPLCLKWTGNMCRKEDESRKLSVQISGKSKRIFPIQVRTVRQLSLPTQSLDYKKLCEKYPHIRGLPIEDFKDAVPKLLLGLNNLKLCLPTRVKEGNNHEPVAICTRLGWFLCGRSGIRQNVENEYNFFVCECEQENVKNLSNLLKQFYTVEMTGINNPNKVLSKDDERAMNMLKKYTKQRTDGHYETALLWRYDNIALPESYNMAKKRLICLEKAIKSNEKLFDVFKNTISEYLEKGYICKVDNDQQSNANIWYLPIFPVINKNKPNKIRLVWDAAAKVNGVSLNSMLLKGPDLLASLPAILFRFRQKNTAICGDIEQMFHQIFIRKEDCSAQRFLWRSCDEAKDPEIYEMKVMIFGASCAPCISQYVKNINASKFENKYPLAAAAIKENHYVDDFLASMDTPEETINLAREVRFIHSQGGFNIRNWCSNNLHVLKALNYDTSPNNTCINMGAGSETEKILGVFWIPADDAITFKLSPSILNNAIFLGTKEPTKREVLKILMSIYDPLGLVGNFIMYLKIVLQEIWRSGVEWDEPIKEEQQTKWKNWLTLLPNLKNVIITRCYLKTFQNYNNLNVQLHTIVDASESGYADVAYLRISDGSNVVVSLIGSKTRVAPLKVLSIPRLELMAAVIGARFANYIVENHTITIHRKVFWSDSRTVLSWIQSDHRRYHQFVAVRVGEILDTSEMSEWLWIPTKINVADDATKCSKLPNLSDSSCWFNGPGFLKLPEEKWPTFSEKLITDVELKECNLVMSYIEPLINIQRFSRWCRALRAIAYVVRFHNRLKNKHISQNKTELTQDELSQAEKILIKDTQNVSFHTEIKCLLKNEKLKKSSPLYKLSPYIDYNGVLRVGGRIDNANVPEELKHPAILPKYSRLTTLIIWHYHDLYRHINHETVVNELRQRYYVPNLRVVCKSAVKQCQMCKIKNALPDFPQMAKLPRARLGVYFVPFTFTGVDFFGPILVNVNRHKEKRYGALFTCLTIRAVHIEIVHSLNTSSCIMAIRKFVSRRGQPREFYTDNGTNFVGAERELRETLKEVDKNELVRNFTTFNTKWNFNPPSAPHMGGAWERMVRSVKTVFYKIKLDRFPNDETLQSMMAEIENIINSRPLTYVPLENENDSAITPNHFLLGSSNGLKPLALYHDDGVFVKESWLCSQQYAQKFWKRWVTEYLPTLTCRTKWFEKAKPLAVGDLVVVVDPAHPRNVWPRGKVIEVNMSEDGQVRRAKVMTASGVLERPAVKLAILDVTPREK